MVDTVDISELRPSFADPDIQSRPFETYANLRECGSVYRNPKTGYSVVLDYKMLREVLMDTDRFSSSVGIIQVRTGEIGEKMRAIQERHGVPSAPVLLTTDPPEHTFFRSLGV